MTLLDRFTGAMVGLGVGDALGMPAEFMRHSQIPIFFQGKITDYEPSPKGTFELGEYTDDTCLSICIAESIIDLETVDIFDISERFLNWLNEDGRGVGTLTYRALTLLEDGFSPEDSGRCAWETSGKNQAGNGAIMRTAPIGLFLYNNKKDLIKYTKNVCEITHFDRRCVLSTVAYNLALSGCVKGMDNQEIYDFISKICCGKDDEFDDFLYDAKNNKISYFILDDEKNMGYTYLTFSIAISALFNYKNFEEPLIEIVNAGGDTDTNAAVAGALLGAKYGIDSIPLKWQHNLVGYSKLLNLGEEIYNLSK